MIHGLRGLALASAFMLAGCSQEDMIARIMPDGADARARAYLSLLVRGEVDSAAARLVPELQTPEARAQLALVAEELRDRNVDSLAVIGVQVNNLPDVRHVNIEYELGDARGWLITNVAVRETGTQWAVEGVRAQQTTSSLKELNRFRLAGQSPARYLWILLMIVAAAVSVAAAVIVARTRGMPKRWWWVLVALVGVGQFALNWTTGQWEFRPIQFQLLAAGYTKSGPVAPWVLSFSLPIGAVVALWRRRRWQSGVLATAAATDDLNRNRPTDDEPRTDHGAGG
jgi:hypothetical protein